VYNKGDGEVAECRRRYTGWSFKVACLCWEYLLLPFQAEVKGQSHITTGDDLANPSCCQDPLRV